jgi:N-acetylneuraminic acid mutarotase
MGGSDTIGANGGQPGVYGVEGVADAANTPGARFSSSTWVDGSGNLWLFGGQGFDWTGASSGILNDLWEYTPNANNTGRWAWMGGSDVIPPSSNSDIQSGQPGVYGTLGTPAPANTPGARIGAVPWIDASGNLWLFGGLGNDSTDSQGYLNDVWKFQP